MSIHSGALGNLEKRNKTTQKSQLIWKFSSGWTWNQKEQTSVKNKANFMGSLIEAALLGSCHSMLFYEAGDVAQLGNTCLASTKSWHPAPDKPGDIGLTCDPNTWVVEARGSEVQGHLQLLSKFKASTDHKRLCFRNKTSKHHHNKTTKAVWWQFICGASWSNLLSPSVFLSVTWVCLVL